ncbi:hypothetical protein EDEG_00048 [Edhazardia aedis USNM 41457]|uniref:Uncharacterized protein n=1 Tax=Edhazardia aedis (strain USNM 41457) TaxID=1003232 RepID=J9DD37_EDHAE|nr:hypothetical protein EDEG_00048 [Edhazardia aedis USNM 41457]|eukprot:EJW05384.1 hypothetical protein EDEG_00048 [Edhazardia aedis USNM 41457]
MADHEIEELLAYHKFETKEDLKNHVDKTNKKIHHYELQQYEEENYTEKESEKIARWRKELAILMHQSKKELNKKVRSEIILDLEAKNKLKELESTVKIANVVDIKASTNIQKLDRSTIVLKKLGFTSNELQQKIDIARKNKRASNEKTLNEDKMIILGFVIFIITCLIIIVDKFGGFKFVLRIVTTRDEYL